MVVLRNCLRQSESTRHRRRYTTGHFAHLKQWVFPSLTEEKVASLVRKTMTNGIDYKRLSKDDANLLDVVVDGYWDATLGGNCRTLRAS